MMYNCQNIVITHSTVALKPAKKNVKKNKKV